MEPLKSWRLFITISVIICVTAHFVSSASIRSETGPFAKDEEIGQQQFKIGGSVHNDDHTDEGHDFDDGHTHAPVVENDQDGPNEMTTTTPSSDGQSVTPKVEIPEDEMKIAGAADTVNRKKRWGWGWNNYNDPDQHSYQRPNHYVEYHRPYCHYNHCHRGHWHHYYNKK